MVDFTALFLAELFNSTKDLFFGESNPALPLGVLIGERVTESSILPSLIIPRLPGDFMGEMNGEVQRIGEIDSFLLSAGV